MSRIERALEKAAARRKQEKGAIVEKSQPLSAEIPDGAGRGKEATLDEMLSAEPVKVNNPKLVALKKNDAVAFEEYNKLRSQVVQLTQGENFLNVLMVTSCIGEEGKSLTSLNLAISMARSYDNTVLLVDTDFRRPTLHKSLGIEPEIGLIHCLRDNQPLSRAMIKTGIGKLVFLPAGGAINNPVEMLESKRMKEIIRELKNRYPERYVIFDTPPILPFADAQTLAKEVDGILFVVREGRTRISEIKRAMHTIRGNNLLGFVYNDARVSMNKKNHYYYS